MQVTGDALEFHPLTPDRWDDLLALFGSRGACSGCWCMWWRQSGAEFSRQSGDGNREALHALVQAGAPTGLLAYAGDRAVGWCAIAPRADYPRLARSRTLKAIDDQPVWSVTCFFTARDYRRQGVTERLLEAAVAYAQAQGAAIIEGYPVEAEDEKLPAVSAFTGLASTFYKTGFREVARNSPRRPILRRALDPWGEG